MYLGDAAAKIPQFLGTYLSRIHNPKFEITIVGAYASATGQKTHNDKLSEQRAQNVSAILTGDKGLHHKIQPSGVGQAGADATEQWRKVEIASATPPGWQNMQDTTAHEFGHMIGLGDEYMGDDPTQHWRRITLWSPKPSAKIMLIRSPNGVTPTTPV